MFPQLLQDFRKFKYIPFGHTRAFSLKKYYQSDVFFPSNLLIWFKCLNSTVKSCQNLHIFLLVLSESRSPDCNLLIMQSANQTPKLKSSVQNNLVKTNRCYLCALSLASDFIKFFLQWHHSYKRNNIFNFFLLLLSTFVVTVHFQLLIL